MAKKPSVRSAAKQEVEEYFAARNRELTRRAMERATGPLAEAPARSCPIEFVRLFCTDRIEKDYGPYRMSFELGRGFRKKAAGSNVWEPANEKEIRIFRGDIRAAAANDAEIARYIANSPDFR